MRLLVRTFGLVLGILLVFQWQMLLAQPISFVGSATAESNSSDPSVSLPGLQADDILIFTVVVRNAVSVTTPPVGWTLVTGVVTEGSTTSFVYTKKADGSETDVSLTISTGSRWAASALVYRNAKEVNSTIFSTNSSSNSNLVANGVTPVTDSSRIVAIFTASRTGNAGNVTFSANPPAGMTERVNYSPGGNPQNQRRGIYIADELRPIANATGTRQVNLTNTSNQNWVAFIITLEPNVIVLPPPSEDILYSYQSGNWNDPLSWTRDPSGTTLIPIDGVLPVNGDSVVVLNGRTITATADISTEGMGLRINSGGVLNLSTFQITNPLRALSGNGRFRSARTTGGITYMPSVVGGENRLVSSTGGTVEYYGNSNLTLNPSISTYFDLEIAGNTSGAVTFSQTHNLTIFNNLVISRTGSATPTYQLGSATSQNLQVNGSLLVNTGCNFRVATNNVEHFVSIGGDLINNGSVRFLNALSASYTAQPGNGRATVTFTGLSDRRIDCFGETNFNRIILDKGSDATYVLTVNSSAVGNFNLWGTNNQSNNPAQNPANATPQIFKALTLNNGTLRLKENIAIPSLTEGGDDFWVRSTAALWIDGAEVYTTIVGNGTSYQAITITGRLIVSGGMLDTRDAAGIIYTIDGVVEIRGGNVRAAQMRQTGGGQTAYVQTGGTVLLDGAGENATGTPRFELSSTASSFTMSGGILEVRNPNNIANGGFDVNVNVVNGNVTGGTVRFVTTTGTNFQFRSTVPFFNLESTRTAGTGIVTQNSALTVLNHFSILNGQTHQSSNNNLSVGGDFTIASGTVYNPGTNTVTMNGVQRQRLVFDGSITGGAFNNFVVNKAADTLVLEGSNGTVVVAELFDFAAGNLLDGGKTIEVRSNLTVSGACFGTGKLLLNTVANRNLNGNGQGRIQNLEIAGPADHVLVSVNCPLRIAGDLNFITNGAFRRIFDVGAHNLTLGASASITNASELRFIKTNGLQSAGGITKEFSSNSFTFAVGSGNDWKYTPATVSFNVNPTTYGSMTIRPVNAQHPAVTEGGKALQYYWRISSNNFVRGSALLTYTFKYINGDALANQANYVPAYIDFSDIVWSVGSSAAVDEGNQEITFADASFNTKLGGEFTAGDNSAPSPFGAVTVYYSRVNGGAWNDANTWTTNPDHVTVAPPANPPGGNSIVRIGNGSINHTILVTANNAVSGNLVIASGSVLDLQTFTGNNFGSIAGETIAGNGLLKIGKNATAVFEFPGGDFGDFLGSQGGEVEYYNATTATATLPTVAQYRRLKLTTASTGNILLPLTNLNILDTLKVNAAGSGVVRTNETNATGGNVTVGHDLRIDQGVLELACPGTSAQRIFDIQGKLIVANGATLRTQGSGTTTHLLRLQGDLLNNGTVDLRTGTNQRADLRMQGNASAKITGAASSTRLAGLIIDKGTTRDLVVELDVTGTLDALTNAWLTLLNGTFKYNRTGTITIHDATSSVFEILESTAISVNNGTVNLAYGNNNASDLVLRGLLEVTGGSVNIGNPANTGVNNDIIVAAAGSPRLQVSGGSLRVNGQIRRDLQSQAGALQYQQSGSSTVRVLGQAANNTRGMIEVVNSGSTFEMGGTAELIINWGGSVNFADLYVRPDQSEVTGGTVRLTPTDVGSNQTYRFDVTYSFYNLEILPAAGNTATVELNVNNLIVNNDLTLAATSTLNCNNLNVRVGRKFLKQGTYNGGTNTVTFFGNAAELEGDFSTQQLHNLTVQAGANLILTGSSSIRVNNVLRIESGATFNDNGKLVDLKGNVFNEGTHSSPSNASSNTLQFTGAELQEVAGNGVFGNLVVNNAAGVYLRGPATINRQLTLSNGLLDIGEHRLTLSETAPAVSGTFSATRMIRSNGVLSDGGVVKNYPANAASFTWPVGVFGKYTPATINLTTNNAAGTIRMRVVGTKHPSTRDAAENQLNYYWQVDTTGFGSFNATHTYNYLQEDVTGTEGNYRAGRFEFPNWSPIGGIVGAINTSTNVISLTGVNYISGGFTAGAEVEFAAVATYYSRNATNGGNWGTAATWSTDGHGGDPAPDFPIGAPVVIADGHTVTVNTNNRLSESLRLNGTATLDLTNSFAHNFGVVSGTGRIRMRATAGQQFVFPGGNYAAFVADTGGTVEFYNSDPGILPTQTTYNKVILKDGAARTQPNVDYVVNGLWTIEAGSLSNQTFGRTIEIRDNWVNQVGAGGYVPGTGTVRFNSADAQTITGVTAFYKIEFAGGGTKTLNDSISVANELRLTGGRVLLGNHNLFMDSTAQTAGSPSASAMVVQNGSGRLIKRVRAGQPVFTFAIGEESATAEYSPATIFFTSGTFAADASVSVQVVDGDAPECGSGANYISRYWSWNASGVSNYSATVSGTYVQADVIGEEAEIAARMSQSGPCLNGSLANVNTNQLTITVSVLNILTGGEAPLDTPTISATLLVFSNVTGNSMTISWTRGNGSGRLVVVRAVNAVNETPENGTNYTADTDFSGSPEDLGNGNLVVYVGADSVFTLTGLQAETDYHIAIFEFNNSGIERVFKFSDPLIGLRRTLANEPTVAVSGLQFSVIGVAGFQLNWTNGNGNGRVVLMKAGSMVDASPADGVSYAANPVFGQGAELGTGNFVVYADDANQVSITGLDQNTRYHVQVFEFNGSSGAENYLMTNAPVANQHTWLRLQLKAFLEGPFNGTNEQLRTDLSTVLPRQHPYGGGPWNFTSYDSIQNLPAGSLVDWVLVELRMAGAAANATNDRVKGRVLAFLDQNGNLLDTAGNVGVVVPTDSNGQFYAALYHRTHVPVMSANTPAAPMDQENGAFSYDFTTAVTQAYGTDALFEVKSGVWALYAGRVENTTPNTIDQADRNATWADRNKLGYEASDAALEGLVDATDRSLTWNNRNVTSQIPQ